MFIVSAILIGWSFRITNKIFSKILLILGLALPCLMAGLRDLSVGSDTGNIYYNYYKFAKNFNSFNAYVNYIDSYYVKKDILYELLTYMIAHSKLSYNLLLFINQFLVIFPIYYSLKKISVTREGIINGIFIYYLLLYNRSLNMMRQSISIAFIILAFSFLYTSKSNKDKLWAILFSIISSGFHSTAIIGICLLFLYELYTGKKTRKYNNIFSILLLAVATIFLLEFKQIAELLSMLKITDMLSFYLKRYSQFDFDFTGAITNITLIMYIIINKKKLNLQNYEYAFCIACLNLILSLLSTFIMYSGRISYYMFYIIAFCFIPQLNITNRKQLYCFTALMLIFVANWFIIIILNNSNETLPYIMINV